MKRTKTCAAWLALALSGAAHAQSVTYEGTLMPGASATGSIGGFSWGDEDAAGSDFWSFSGMAGDRLSLSVTRTDAALDPALSLYFGRTEANPAFFLNDADWGGLVYLTFADDEAMPMGQGPGGDPRLDAFTLPFTGQYTLAVGGFNSLTEGPYAYSVNLALQPIPEPSAVMLLLAGLGLVGGLRLRQRREA